MEKAVEVASAGSTNSTQTNSLATHIGLIQMNLARTPFLLFNPLMTGYLDLISDLKCTVV